MAREDVSELASLLHDEYVSQYGVGSRVPVDQVRMRAKSVIAELALDGLRPVDVVAYMVSQGQLQTHGREYVVKQ